MKKLINLYRINKRSLYCIMIITIIGIIAGSLFYFLLSSEDKDICLNAISSFFNNLNNFDYKFSLKSNLISNLLYIFIIWVLGISVIGIPIILLLYFLKTFSIGFTLVAIISKYGFKGVFYAFIYLFPHNMINMLSLAILSIYGIICSFRILSSISKKERIDIKIFLDNYKLVLVTSILITILSCLYQSFIMPNILKVLLIINF